MSTTASSNDSARRSAGHTILSYRDLKSKGIPFSRQWVAALIKAGKFPAPIKLGEASVGFVEQEIDDWIADLIKRRDEKAAR